MREAGREIGRGIAAAGFWIGSFLLLGLSLAGLAVGYGLERLAQVVRAL